MLDTLIYYICIPLGALMRLCTTLIGDYALAIILFTLATKLILLPLSVWIHKNSILMVKLQPEINFIKARHYGDGDTIAEEQSKLFKEKKYRPLLSLVPLIIQIVLLMGVVYIIYHPLDYLFGVSEDVTRSLAAALGLDMSDSAYQLKIIRAVQDGNILLNANTAGQSEAQLAELFSQLKGFDLSFFGLDIGLIPSETGGLYLLVPIAAGLSAWVLCFTQNLSNVIQHEQGRLSKYGLMALSVGISLYLGCFVPAGIAVYWIASNLFAVIQMYILNALINPKRYVDYDALEKSRKALAELDALESGEDRQRLRANRARERRDYKRFFKIVNKHIVFYSEKSGFYKYFSDLIDALERRADIVIHYITNDPDDVIFEIARERPFIKPYYIGIKKSIPLMMRLEADIVVMTTPDLDKLFIKRSIMKKDIEYIYVPHDTMSMHMGFRENALDEFDTVFCAGPHLVREIRATERYYGLKPKTLVEFGYPLADRLGDAAAKAERRTDGFKEILIAPSWNPDNVIDSCLDALIAALAKGSYHLTVRPHPEYVKRFGAKMNAIVEKYASRVGENLSFELDFSTNKSIYSSDLLITDWSGIAPEFCFATRRPALFINTELKCLNKNWQAINCEPAEIYLRTQLGVALEKNELYRVEEVVADLLARTDEYAERIPEIFDRHIFNHGKAADVGAKYILSRLVEKQKQQK